MKKKIAVLLMFVFSLLTVFTGCNLFNTDNYAALSSIVATSGNIQITRESLINAYNNGGYYYNTSYGYTREEALKMTIDELINQEYLLEYIKESNDNRFVLDNSDYCKIVSDSWSYIDSALSTYIDEVRSDFGLSTEDLASDEESEDPEYAPQACYSTKFEKVGDNIIYIGSNSADDTVTVHVASLLSEASTIAYAKSRFNYENHIRSTSRDYKKLVWKKYLSALKSSQEYYGYKDMTDETVFSREMERIVNANIKSQKLTKFQNVMEQSLGYNLVEVPTGENGETQTLYAISETRLNDMVAYYKKMYKANVESYNSSKSSYYTSLTATSGRENYVYYGNTSDETLITCIHILVKLSDTQTTDITTYNGDPQWQGEALESKLAEIKSMENTYATERDLTTGENVLDANGNTIQISVAELYNNLKTELRTVTGIEDITRVFNSYMYRYNVDTGIINAVYDYVVGTETSAMVESFTNVVRDLYDDGNGKIGSLAEPILEESSNYSGYHIVLYTGTLKNVFASETELNTLTANNIYSKLSSEMTSVSYNETTFEKIFDSVASDNYSTYRTNLLSSLKNGVDVVYDKGNYSDLYE